MAKRLIPTFSRFVVEKVAPPSKTNAGIPLPEKTTKLNSGKVNAVVPVHFADKHFVDAFLLRMKNKKELLMNKKIWSRRSSILPEFVGCSVRIYNGKTHVPCKITEDKYKAMQYCNDLVQYRLAKFLTALDKSLANLKLIGYALERDPPEGSVPGNWIISLLRDG